jgi:Holliday junction resolvase
MNSKQKGNRGERLFSKLCKEHGYETRRSQQYAGGNDSADVTGLPGIHIEVKAWDTITEGDKANFIRQAIRDAAGSKNIPIVAHKEDYRQWFITMEMTDFVLMFMESLNEVLSYPINGLYDIETVTMTAEAWFKLYKEYEAGKAMEGKP